MNNEHLAGFSTDLPTYNFADQIVTAVDNNQAVIITAETGAGKSTQVPQYLAEHGYDKVVVTQPRILAARNLSRRVREEWAIRTGKDSDEVIGYRTAHERDDSTNTQILYCTDGLQLVREITGAGVKKRQVLVLDEVHEWNENMEVLIAWAKKRCQEDPRFKVVVMSATLETESLAQYFGTEAIISVPGRGYPVEKFRGTDVISEIFNKLTSTEPSNMLVFLPGKAEIQNVQDAVKIKAEEAGVPVIPLHSQLEATAQQQAFSNYLSGKIILATNIAQTSVTIDDIDVVIDSGLERRSEVRSGVEGLFIAQISQADCLQRAGRAGRTKPGEYILAPYDNMPCLEFEEREEYGTPEILRKHIDRLTLRLANINMDIEELDFYHDPSRKAIQRAKRTLIALGALTKNNQVTRIGRIMEQFPVESSYARMLVEAQDYGPEIQAKLAAIIGIQEVGGIVKGGTRYTGWRKYTRQTQSDLLAQYDVLLALPGIDPEEYEEVGIISKNIDKAREVMERLERDLGLDSALLTPVTDEQKAPLMRCIVAGQIDQLWVVEHSRAIHIMTNKKREISSSTVVRSPKLVAGTPFDLQIPTRSGELETLHLVQGLTQVNTDWLIDLSPNMFDKRKGKVYFDAEAGRLGIRQLARFGKRVLEGSGQLIYDNTPQNQRLFIDSFAKWAYEQLERERFMAGRHHGGYLPKIPLKYLQQRAKSMAGNIISLEELSPHMRKKMLALAQIKTHLGEEYEPEARPHSGRKSKGPKKGRRGWKAAHRRKYDRHDKRRSWRD